MNADPRTTFTVAVRGISSTRQARQARPGGSAGRRAALVALAALAGLFAGPAPSWSQDLKSAPSFVDDFTSFNRQRWYVSDGWTNGGHQNCTWAKGQVSLADGVLSLGFEKQKTKDRDYACGEIQTKQRFGYGTYEARMKTDTGPGLNAAFFSYIGPSDKQPWDEIDFEILTKDTSKVQVNAYIAGKGKNEKLVDVPGGTEKAFNDYAFVWQKDSLRWYVNGQLVNTITDPAKLPSHAQKIFFSLWGSDTMTGWLGAFADPGRKLSLQIERVAFTAQGEPCQFPESLACSVK
ncbi:glycosyl hydrolase family protein [Mesorhizobium sp. B2-2-4]|uniref:endo-1,3-1,4-beta-glycanase ExoK n=1 Tax=unclassified Mesorhizobium TaxID=325217 RepID=UPI00112C97A5|nr:MULTISPECIES: family 16 glycosylhydrolase [unclassified Mesorhizobium]MCA0054943.1 family 16 glycosylhydrolase [Mesorhizobium sp. B261B1A]TPK36028.1 glycosyl hydrolase family protein [Mesorhizobium sp. B2-5-3]TPL15240.1 glycosyl hydrolase family protein [Mesorhizobium sp. B2-4-11]TPM59309.1 glycosyl hydrolase family protein [Mesorhizobium sp. B2-2-4]TPM67794.1 glycosyl hydrolase family protein [Mesorhizobium sp. B2-2-1]